ncbi:TonB-dependent siderophore receptor [Marinobacterium sp. LSUCC0821]|uniref:TonB-dependent receptor plug domain-containing protein n=1 Tax=Marinobacterium sp. LSUCC0821 TaxID=2668067 RepID=UPI0014517F2B|nr:TonB-dependent receptor [Marinobacterium sp. LSUCC0821]QJD70415.1 TonB-dependent receptor [Marinobacterium sp. LSUCC0821]
MKLLTTLILAASTVSSFALANPITVFVTGSRMESSTIGIPAAKTVITSDEILNSGASTLTDILRQQSFIQITDSSGVNGKGNIDMRGFGEFSSFNTVILIDGQKINRAADQSSIDLNMFNLEQIDRIEIIKGSAGVLYGHEAVGGVINIITKKNNRRHNSASVEVGSFDRSSVKASIGDYLSKDSSFNLTLERTEANNFRDHNDSDLKKFNVNFQKKSQLGDTQISIQRIEDYWLNSGPLSSVNDVLNNPTVSQNIYADDWYDKKGTSIKLNHLKSIDSINTLTVDAFVNSEKTNANAYIGGSVDNTIQDRKSVSFSPRVISNLNEDTNLLTGIDYTYTDYAFSSSFGPMNIDQNIYAVYGVLDHKINDRVTINTGLRHAYMEYTHIGNTHTSPLSQKNNDNQTVGNIGLTLHISPNWSVDLRADQNYRFALVDEHNNYLYAGSTSTLKTQTGNSYEAALTFEEQGTTAQIQAYTLRLDDELIYDGANYLTTNFEKTERNGISISLKKSINELTDLNFGYDYLNAKVENAVIDYYGTTLDFNNKTIPLTAKHSANAGVTWKTNNGLINDLNWKYIGERYVGADFLNNYDKIKGYSTFNFSSLLKQKSWEFSFKLNNIFDKKSVNTASLSGSTIGYYPITERNLSITAKYYFE